jgi:hypothetical protein
MKKIALFLLGFCLILSSCKNRNRYEINYDGPATIDIVLLEELGLNVTSDYPLTYYSDNELVVTVSENGVILGKNIGEANVVISNAESTLTLKVIVSLFEEPTLNFYCDQSYMEEVHGTPKYKNDSLMIYGSGEDWHSFAVWEMDFFFINNQYVEADLYIEKDLEIRVDEYLKGKFIYKNQVTDDETNVTYDIYLNNENPENATVLVGKIKDAGPYEDICLFYIPYEHKRNSNYNDIFSRDRRRK